jgi:hypothetical protein
MSILSCFLLLPHKHTEDMEGQEEVWKMLPLAGVENLLSNGGKVREITVSGISDLWVFGFVLP